MDRHIQRAKQGWAQEDEYKHGTVLVACEGTLHSAQLTAPAGSIGEAQVSSGGTGVLAASRAPAAGVSALRAALPPGVPCRAGMRSDREAVAAPAELPRCATSRLYSASAEKSAF